MFTKILNPQSACDVGDASVLVDSLCLDTTIEAGLDIGVEALFGEVRSLYLLNELIFNLARSSSAKRHGGPSRAREAR